MDAAKLAYFQGRYSSLDVDALVELHERRDSLAEEACAALEEVLAQRGVAPTMLSRYSDERKTETRRVASRNWKLATMQLLGALAAMFAASSLAHILPRWLSIVVLCAFVLWWAVGRFAKGKQKGAVDE